MKKKDFPPKPPSAMHTTPAFLSPQTPLEQPIIAPDDALQAGQTRSPRGTIEGLIPSAVIQEVVELLERAQKDTYMVKSTEAHHVLWGAIDEAIGILKEAIK